MKTFLLSLVLGISLFANNCSPYFNPEKFYDAPPYLEELIEEKLLANEIPLFGEQKAYEKLQFKKSDDSFIDESRVIQYNQLIYPHQTGLWKYSVNNKKVDELNLSVAEFYQFSDIDIANEINYNFEEFWSDWIEDGYEMQLVPEQTLFRYKKTYFSFSVFIYGVKKDATPLKKTVVNYWFKNYTPQVKEYIQCAK